MNDPDNKGRPKSRQNWLPGWFIIAAVFIGILTLFKALGLQVFLQIDYDGYGFLTAITELETWYLPLGLLLVYLLLSGLWELFIKSSDDQ